MAYTISNHAYRRWYERFRNENLEEELKAALPFGGQRGNDKMLLSPCEAVFVIAENTVVTILEKHHAISNIQVFLPNWKTLSNKAIPANNNNYARVSTIKTPEPQNLFTDEVKALIKQHAQEVKDGLNSKADKKRRQEEMKSFGIGAKNKEYRARLSEAIYSLSHDDR